MVGSSSGWTKVVVRKLPANLKEAAFKVVLDEFVPDRYNWFSFLQGKISRNKLVYSRAYINFNDSQDVLYFKNVFEAHAFVNEKGTQLYCTVEFAPFQRVPREPSKVDLRESTLEKDADYQSFCRKLQDGSKKTEPQAKASDTLSSADVAAPLVITPLMQYILDKRSGKLQDMKRLLNKKDVEKLEGSGSAQPSLSDRGAQGSKRKSVKGPVPGVVSGGSQSEPKGKAAEKKRTVGESKRGKKPLAQHSEQQGAGAKVKEDKPVPKVIASSRQKPSEANVNPEEAAPTPRVERTAKPLRVREGFGVWAPKRVGRLAAEEPSTEKSEASQAKPFKR